MSNQPGSFRGGSGAAGGGIGYGGTAAANKAIEYICADCAATVRLRPKEPIKCQECAARILYKKRTNKMVSTCPRWRQKDSF